MYMFKGIWSDFVYAARSLAKARAFTFVCIVSLGIGMAPVSILMTTLRLWVGRPSLHFALGHAAFRKSRFSIQSAILPKETGRLKILSHFCSFIRRSLSS